MTPDQARDFGSRTYFNSLIAALTNAVQDLRSIVVNAHAIVDLPLPEFPSSLPGGQSSYYWLAVDANSVVLGMQQLRLRIQVLNEVMGEGQLPELHAVVAAIMEPLDKAYNEANRLEKVLDTDRTPYGEEGPAQAGQLAAGIHAIAQRLSAAVSVGQDFREAADLARARLQTDTTQGTAIESPATEPSAISAVEAEDLEECEATIRFLNTAGWELVEKAIEVTEKYTEFLTTDGREAAAALIGRAG
jgi:hypothetical protein